jgi:hypothetical protein
MRRAIRQLVVWQEHEAIATLEKITRRHVPGAQL